ncbi:MAG: VWA domain-containing protein [Acidobacteriota bacterium]
MVTDRRGQPITNLRPSDFQLFENGAARATSVEFRGSSGPGESRPRVFAFLVDEFHIPPGEATDRVRAALSRFVDVHLRPQDLALVSRPLDDPAAMRFTGDAAALRAAIANVSGRQGDLTPRGDFEAQYIGRAPAAVAAARRQIVSAALRNLTLRLGDLHADRPILIVVGDGTLPGTPGGRLEVQGLVRAASRFHLAVYAFGLGDRPPAAAPPVAAPEAGTLGWLAEQTGGRSFTSATDLSDGLERLARDAGDYYAVTTAAPPADGRFHALELRTTRRDLVIRARPGYWAPFEPPRRAAAAMKPIVGRAVHRSPLIDTAVTLTPDASGRTVMVIAWESRPGIRVRPVLAMVRARTAAGADLFSGRLAPIRASGSTAADSARFDVPAGRVEIDLDVLDEGGKLLDRDTRDIDVPDFAAEPSARARLFPQLIRARTLRDFDAIRDNPDAAPSASRAFLRGDRLLIRVPVFDSRGAAVEVSASVLNGRGELMRNLEEMPGAGAAQFGLPLSWLGPGSYLLQIVGRTAAGATTERQGFTVRW